jgi:hypothetical protein
MGGDIAERWKISSIGEGASAYLMSDFNDACFDEMFGNVCVCEASI